MNQSIAQEIGLLKEFLNQQNDLGIIIGNHQNLDTYAASLAMYLTLTQAGKKVQIISKKAPTVEVSNLVAVDRIKESFVAGNTSKLVVSLPYIKGEVEKVLFTEFPDPQNPTNINFHLTAAEGKSITPFELNDVKLIWEGGAPSAIIAIGAGSLDEISSIVDENATKIVNIDNFSGNTRYGDVVLVDDTFSSLSEVIGKIIKDLSLPLDVDSAQNILDGVLYSTRNFTKGNTSPLAFEAVSNAMYVGALRKIDTNREMPQQSEPQFQPRQNQPRQNPQPQQDRGRDQRGQASNNNRSQRINENDFPAMHMQNRQQNQQSQQNPRNNQPRQQQNAPRQNQQFGQNRQQNAPRQNQQFGQNSSDIEELMRKINEENKNRRGVNNPQFNPQPPVRPQQNQQNNMPDLRGQEDQYQPQIQDAEIVNPPIVNAPIDDIQVPEQMPYTPPSPDEVPDDWLMPKVFKSSKNNN